MNIPDLYVKIPRYSRGRSLFKARLQTKQGYLYLCWREFRTVKTLYLGKAKKSSPTSKILYLGKAKKSSPTPTDR